MHLPQGNSPTSGLRLWHLPQMPRWELFMGDRPHCLGPDEQGLRPPIQQIALAESSALPGDVILSREAAEVRLDLQLQGLMVP